MSSTRNQGRSESPLTEREVEVLKLVAQGLTNQEIADRLTISEWTVRTPVCNILGKLHPTNRTQATLYALQEGLAKSRGEANLSGGITGSTIQPILSGWVAKDLKSLG